MNIFVTGTDTGIGKTVVSAILCLKLGYNYWKPIQSGLDEQTDSDWVADRIGRQFVRKEAYRFRNPLSPHLSAEMEEAEIHLEKIKAQAPVEHTVIEGCGGLLVPLHSSHFIADLIRKLECPVVLVAKSSVGTINHTLLSLEAMRSRRIEILGVVMVGEKNPGNIDAIERFGKISVIGQVPLLGDLGRRHLADAGTFINLENEKWK